MPEQEYEALKVVIEGLKVALQRSNYEKNCLKDAVQALSEQLKSEKKMWVDLSVDDLDEMGVNGPVKYTWVMAAQEKLKELNT